MNGYFQLVCDKNRTSIRIFPATGEGKAVSVVEIGEYLSNRGISYDRSALVEIVGNGRQEIEINKITCSQVREGYKLVISPDKMQVIARFYPPSINGEKMSAHEFVDDLKFKRVNYGINEEEIERFFNERIYCQDYVVAEGTQPRHGADAYIEYYFNTDLSAKPTLKEDGSVDFFNLNTISHCRQGDVLAKLFPEDLGDVGYNVEGEKVKPRDVKKCKLKFGRNITLSDDKLSLISDVDGHVSLVEGKVFVSDVLTVENVDSSTGNIEYDGNVQVNGTVCANFSVKARGNIEVNGVVEGAQMEAGGDIIIAKGMNGMGKGVLNANGNIISKFLENTTATALGYVSAESILHSTVYAGDEIMVTGRRGFITGGRVCATNAINVKTLGSSMGADTLVEVGADPTIKVRIQNLQWDIANASRVIKSVKPLIDAARQKKAKGIKLTPEQLQYTKSLIALHKVKEKEIEDKAEEMEKLQESIGTYCNAQIIVTGVVFPGTKICIGDVSMVIQREAKYCRFIKEDGDVKLTAI